MAELIFAVLGGSFLIALGILAIHAVKSRRRANPGPDASKNEPRRMDGNRDTSRYYVSPGNF